MCFHNALTQKPKAVAKYYGVESPDDLYQPMPHGVGFSHPQWPVVSMEEPRRLKLKSWGLIPTWVKQAEQAKTASNQNLNARAETVFEKPSFREAIRTGRCLVPSTGFFEWREMNKLKYPYFIYPVGEPLFTMAGISTQWLNRETGELHESFAILTTQANATLSMIHNVKQRMPVLLSSQQIADWLNPNTHEEKLTSLFEPYSDSGMNYFTVNRETMKYPVQGEEPILPFIYPELNTLF